MNYINDYFRRVIGDFFSGCGLVFDDVASSVTDEATEMWIHVPLKSSEVEGSFGILIHSLNSSIQNYLNNFEDKNLRSACRIEANSLSLSVYCDKNNRVPELEYFEFIGIPI